jgi:hypothetical protein
LEKKRKDEMSSDARYTKDQIVKHLVGGKITQAIQSFEDGAPENYFEDFAGFTVTKGKRKFHVWVQQDAEGNGAGWLQIEDSAHV